MTWQVYLSGEIHSDWREQIQQGIADKGLDIQVTTPVCTHEDSDEVGVRILGDEADNFWKDHKAAKINAMRIRKHIDAADVVVVKFGDKYRQWNAAFDAGYAAALGKALIIMHGADHQHALKEVDAAALAVTETPDQVAQILRYVINAELDGYT